MSPYLILAVLLFFGARASAHAALKPALSPAVVIAHVAANQDRSNKLRTDYVYRESVRVTSRKPNGKLMCEEAATFLVVPGPSNSTKKLTHIAIRYWHHGVYLNLHAKPAKDLSVDCDVAGSFLESFGESNSKNGIEKDLFPLTAEKDKTYRFWYKGQETLDGRSVDRIGFKPKDKKQYDWAGEADIDEKDFEPVFVYTRLSRQLPFMVRAFLVALPGLGFNVQYQQQPDGVWFPVSFGTEFRLRLFMFYRRVYTIDLANSDFQRTHVTSRVLKAP